MGAEVCMQSSRVVAFLILFLGFQCIQASGQQVVAIWTDASGDWNNPANWSTLTVPNNGGGTTYSVRITVPGAEVINGAGSSTIDNLTLGATDTLSFAGSSLSLVSGASSINGAIGVVGTGSGFFNGAHLTNNGAFSAGSEANLGNSGTFINNSSMSILLDSGITNTAGAIFTNSGT